MSGGDGAHLGVGAERAVETILGGKDQPEESERKTPEQMYEQLKAAPYPWEDGGQADYDSAATGLARIFLEIYEAQPNTQICGAESVYLTQKDTDGRFVDFARDSAGKVIIVRMDIYDVAKALGYKLEEYGFSGFQAGWATNAARYALNLPPVPNPALITIS